MTREELAQFDGRDNREAYVAVAGTIYNVTASSHWKNGNHEGIHQAGQDLTEAIAAAPHVKTIIERFPVVAKLEDSPTKKNLEIAGIPLLSIIIMAFVFMLMIATYML